MTHILLVDDEEALRSVVAERLVDAGFNVTQAADAESARKALDGFAFDVIISDLRLPRVTGAQSESSGESVALAKRAEASSRRHSNAIPALSQSS